MADLKGRYRDLCPAGRGRLHHLPALPATFPEQQQHGARTTNPPHQAPLYLANLKNEALYLASILRARLSDSTKGGGGRGLLSRALARGELDQFLVAFFRDPANLLFAEEKVEERRTKISKMAARLLGPGGKVVPGPRLAAAIGGVVGDGGIDSILKGSSTTHPECHGHNAYHSMGCGRFGPVLADATGNYNILPARDEMNKGVVLLQRDDVSELGSTASRAITEHNESESCHCHGRRHDHHQQQQNEVESVRSCGSLSTVHSECDGSSITTSTSLAGSTMLGMDDSGSRRNIQRERRKRRDRERKNRSKNAPPLSVVDSAHFEAHLLHRVCDVTGKNPGGGGGGSGGSNSDDGSDDARSEFSLLEDSGEHQLALLRRNPEMMRILVRLKALSVSLVDSNGRGADSGSVTQLGGAGNAVGGRTVDVVRMAQQEYLRLFEEMLGELLKTQREKSKAFRAEKRAFQRELERAREVEAAMKSEAEVHAVQLEALLAVKKALATAVATQEAQLHDLAAEVEIRVKMEQEAKREHFAAEAKKAMFLNELKQEEQTLRTRFKEVEVEATKAEMGVRSMKHLTAKVERTAAINKKIYRVDETKYKLIQESAENFSQTSANDDGLWDYQDGLTREVSRNVLQRIKWQAVRRFASCPSCHGIGQHTTVKKDKDKRKLVPCKTRAWEDPTLVHEYLQQRQSKSKRRRGNLDKAWAMPNVLVEFMCHLPKTAMAFPIKPLRWIIREIWFILDERERIDAIDEQEGQAVQNMNDFIVELFLRRHSLRQDAELQLYVFLVSVKAHYKKSVAVHTFARLMDLLNESTTSGNSHNTTVDPTGNDHDSGSKGKASKDKREHYRREEEVLEQEVQPHKSPLGAAFIPVLLFTRRALLKRAKVDLRALRNAAIRERFKSVASLARLREAVMGAFTGLAPPTDEQPLTSDEGGDTATGDIKATAPLGVPGPSTTATAAPTPGGNNEAREGGGAGEGEGGGAPVDGEAADPLAPPSEAFQEPAPKVVFVGGGGGGGGGGAPVVAMGEGGRGATATAAVNNNNNNNRNTSGAAANTPRGSGATGPPLDRKKSVVGPLDRKKSVVGAMFDRNKKKAAATTVKSTGGAAGHGAQGSTKKHVGSSTSGGTGKKFSAPSPVAAGERDHRDLSGHTEVVEAIELPAHILTEDNCTFWVSLEMAVRVLTTVLHWCPAMKRHAYMRSIEKSAALLTSRGHITGVEASHSFIRSAMRKTIAAVEASGAGSSNGEGDGGSATDGITETLGGFLGTFEEGCGVGGVVSSDAAQHDPRVIIEMDRVTELVMEVVLLRQNSIENRLKALFTEGDENGDGVLSYEEFNRIVIRAAPHFSERRVLRMFREALTSGTEGSFAIEKDTFCNVCRQHGLVQLIDVAQLERAIERGPASAARLRLLGTFAPPSEAAVSAQPQQAAAPVPTVTAPTATEETPPQKVKLDISVDIPGEGEADKDGRQQEEEEQEEREREKQQLSSEFQSEDDLDGDGGEPDTDEGGSDGDPHGHSVNDQLSQGDDDTDDDEEEGELVSFLDAEDAPSHLLFERDEAEEEE